MSVVRTWSYIATLLLTTWVGQAHASWKVRTSAALFEGHDVVDLAVWGDRFILAVGDDGTASVVDTLTWQPLLDSSNQDWFAICTDGTDVDEVVDVVEGGSSSPGFLVACAGGRLTEVNINDLSSVVLPSTLDVNDVSVQTAGIVALSRVGETFYLFEEDTRISSFEFGDKVLNPEVLSVSDVEGLSVTAFIAYEVGTSVQYAVAVDAARYWLVSSGGASDFSSLDCPGAQDGDLGIVDFEVFGGDLLAAYSSRSSNRSVAYIDTLGGYCTFPASINSGELFDTSQLVLATGEASPILYVAGKFAEGSSSQFGVLPFDLGSESTVGEASPGEPVVVSATKSAEELVSTSVESDFVLCLSDQTANLISSRPFVSVTVQLQAVASASRSALGSFERVAGTEDDSPSPSEEPTDAEPTPSPTPQPEVDYEIVVKYVSDEPGLARIRLYGGSLGSPDEDIYPVSQEPSSEGTYSFPAEELPQGGLFAQVDISVGDITGSGGAFSNVDLVPELGTIVVKSGTNKVTLTFSEIDDVASYELVISETEFTSADDFIDPDSLSSHTTYDVELNGEIYTWPTEFNAASDSPGQWPLTLSTGSQLVATSRGSVTVTLYPLTDDKLYWIAIRPVDNAGQVGLWSATIEAKPKVTVPSDVLAGESGGFCSLAGGRGRDLPDINALMVVGLIFLRRSRSRSSPRSKRVGGM